MGHGPFSHTLEEILKRAGVPFDHEVMTQRILEEGTEVNAILRKVGKSFPKKIAYFIDKKRRRRDGQEDHWSYRIVSSQLDADRLDYIQRDAMFAGLRGGFDLTRLLDSLQHLDGTRIAVDRRSIVTVEAYLVALDQMYRAVYYHHTVRAASVLLSSIVRRAYDLLRDGDRRVFPPTAAKEKHPLQHLLEEGEKIDLERYVRLGADGGRLAPYYVVVDTPDRTSYKIYDWRSESPDESIWLTGDDRDPKPVEEDPQSTIVAGLKATRYFQRLVFPEEIREALLRDIKKGEGS